MKNIAKTFFILITLFLLLLCVNSGNQINLPVFETQPISAETQISCSLCQKETSVVQSNDRTTKISVNTSKKFQNLSNGNSFVANINQKQFEKFLYNNNSFLVSYTPEQFIKTEINIRAP